MVFIYIYLDISKQFRCILNLINQYRWFMQLQKQFRIGLCNISFVQIIQCYISPLRSLHQFLEHCRLSYLSRSRYQEYRIFPGYLSYYILQISFDITHKSPSFG